MSEIAKVPHRSLFKKTKLAEFITPMIGITSVASLVACTFSTQVFGQPVLEEIVVTARKISENLQDVPISVQAFNENKLEDYGVDNFDDIVALIPSLSYQSLGPGVSQLYFRGVSVDGPTGFGTGTGSQPTVAIYLDEQPVTAIGRNLDLYITDIASVEALAGPQGTLYGASSTSGTIKYITNKPNLSEFEARIEAGGATTQSGDPSTVFEGMINIPIVENRAAVRIVAWDAADGGYIDSVLSTAVFADGQGRSISSEEFVEDDFNDSRSSGVRLKLGVDLSDNWYGELGYTYQELDRNGVFDHDPTDFGDLEVARFFEDSLEDVVDQYSLTLKGDVNGYDIIYGGTFLDREVDYLLDYTSYALQSSYIEYYTCDYDSSYVFTNCGDQRIQTVDRNTYKRVNHELRINSPQDKSVRFTVGLFYENNESDGLLRFQIPGIRPEQAVRPESTYFVTDQFRKETQFAVFGEVSFDMTETLSATLGARYFDATSELKGETGSVFGLTVNDFDSDEKDSIFKVNVAWQPNKWDALFYATYSEGFRVGGANREPVAGAIPAVYKSDLLKNYELGWKTTLLDGRLRFNGAAYYIDWQDIQLSTSDFDFSFLTFTNNIGDAEIKGLEGDLTYQASEHLTLSTSFAFNEAELTSDFSVGGNTAPPGTELPFVPELKLSARARYEREIGGEWSGYSQVVVSYQDESYNDIFVNRRSIQKDYSITNLSIGGRNGSWGVELYANNLFDERATILINAIDFDRRVTVNRPRTIGLKVVYDLD